MCNINNMLIKPPTILKSTPLIYIFEKMNITHKKNTLWFNIGVNNSTDANYISNFTDDNIFCFFKYLQNKIIEDNMDQEVDKLLL